jgi:polysaccharide biosynthesis/export protein
MIRMLPTRWNGLVVAAFFIAISGAAFPLPAHSQDTDNAYRVKPGDKLEISVWKEEGLDQVVVVRPDGGLTFPLAGEIQASGHTIAEITSELTKRITPYIPEALVTVGVSEIRGSRVYIIGQVQMPGQFFANPDVDVMQALSMAGGLTAFAQASDIRVLRRSRDGQQRAISFDYNQLIRGRSLEQNIMLQDGDVLIVP